MNYQDISKLQSTDYVLDFCFSYSSHVNSTIVELINKCITYLGTDYTKQIITDTILSDINNDIFSQFIEQNSIIISISLLILIIVIVVISFIIIRATIINQQKSDKLLNEDSVTGFMSYRKFLIEANKLLKSDPTHYSIEYIDIYNFKYINNLFGYDIGDELLRESARFIDTINNGNPHARIYADQFVVITKYNSQEAVKSVLEANALAFEQSCKAKYPDFNCIYKIGIYFPTEKDTLEQAINYANYAIDSIRSVSKSTCVYFDDSMYNTVLTEQEIEKDMRQSLINNEFETYYQPKFDMLTNKVVGAEALVRWNHPKKGLLPPYKFIPVFEKNRFIVEIDFYIYKNVCQFIKNRLDNDLPVFPISCNFSRIHIEQEGFIDRLVSIAEIYNVPTKYLELEITETVAIEDFYLLENEVNQLKKHGFLISIDDFGSGFSSIQLLYKLPIDVLKFDKEFIQNVNKTKIENELMESIISICKENNIKIICEGIETREQAEYMQRIGCRFAQGYLYSKPVPLSDFNELLSDN